MWIEIASRGVSPVVAVSRRMVRTALVLAVMTAVGPCAPATASSPTSAGERDTTAQKIAAVSGKVEDPSGAVIVGATVSLTPTGAGERYETTTDTKGVYRFDRLPEGPYVALVFRDGFAPLTRDLVVAADQETTLDFKLEIASFKDEVTVTFKADTAVGTLKMDTPLADVPLAVQSYTGSFMKAIESTNVGDLYSYTTGVSRSGNTGIDFVIRGVRASNDGNIQYNGLPGLAARFGSPSTVNVERIEVLKGPSSVLYGQAQPGGLINIVTKKPQAERANVLDIRSGTFFGTGPGFGDRNKGHLAADSTGPIDHDRKFLYRFVASYDDENDFRELAQNKDLYIVPSISWLGWNGAVVNMEFEYRRTRTALDSGLVAPNNDIRLVAPITVRYQEPADYLNEDGKTATLSVKKALPMGMTWTLNFRNVWHGDDTNGFENVGVTGLTTVTRRDRHQVNSRRYNYLDTTFAKGLVTGRIRHKLLFGLNEGYLFTDFDRLQFATGASLNVNLYDPLYGALGLPPKPDTHRLDSAWDSAGYINDQIDLTSQWKALVGLRFTRRDSREQELRINPYLKDKSSQAALPLAGVVYEPNRVFSLYGSFATSFTPPPPGAVDAQGNNPFVPEHARQFEGGIKANLNDRGEASFSWFDITKNDVLITLVAQAINDQIGQERSRGLEATFTERLLNNWQVISGYSFTDSKVTKDSDPVRIGSLIPNAARQAANLWTRYDLNEGALRGLGFGLGLVYSGERAGTIRASTSTLPVLRLPGYFRTDLGIYWVGARYEVTALIVNLFDEQYYESNLGTTTTSLNIRPGAPRAATVSMRLRF
jgi:iron complex outermembrane receptor protein